MKNRSGWSFPGKAILFRNVLVTEKQYITRYRTCICYLCSIFLKKSLFILWKHSVLERSQVSVSAHFSMRCLDLEVVFFKWFKHSEVSWDFNAYFMQLFLVTAKPSEKLELCLALCLPKWKMCFCYCCMRNIFYCEFIHTQNCTDCNMCSFVTYVTMCNILTFQSTVKLRNIYHVN